MQAVKVSEGGRIVIPAELRAKLGIGVGDTLYWQEHGDQLVLTSRRAGIRRAQAIVAQHARPDGGDLTDELIRDRRRQARRE